MFGLLGFFNALARLTSSINTSADLFESANAHLARQLSIDGPAEAPALPAPEAETPGRNGKKAKQTA